MAKFPKSIATGATGAAKATAASSGQKKFTTNFFWRAGDKRFVQFITEYEDIPALPMHVVSVGYNKRTGKTIMRNFVDPRAWFDADADNALAEKGWEPKIKRLIVALEVVPIMGTKNGRKVPVGWEPATRSFTRKNGEEVTVPNVGVITNTQTLFAHIDTYFEDNDTINDAVFSITRTGGDTNTTYSVQGQKGDPVELTEDILSEIDLAAYLESLADPAVIRETVESLPDDWEYDFSKRERGGSKNEKPEVDDDEDDEDEDEDDAEAAARQRRASKFAGMKAQLG